MAVRREDIPVVEDSKIEKRRDGIYETKLGDDVVEFGDSKTEIFKPHLKLTRWNGESSLVVSLNDEGIFDKAVSLEDDKLKWATPKIEVNFYHQPVTTQIELGGIEFEIILTEKPPVNFIDLPINLQNLTLTYQPPLTEQFKQEDCVVWTPTHIETKDGVTANCHENAVGSLAAYHTSKTDNVYKAGKAYQIPRPEAIDADGKRTWCSWQRTDLNKCLRIIIPQKTLDTATYPLIIDPTFGKTDIGAFGIAPGAGNVRSYRHTCLDNALVTTMHLYLTNCAPGLNARTGLYDNDGTNSPVNLLSESPSTATTVNGWQTMDITDVTIAAGLYHLAFQIDNGQAYRYDNSGVVDLNHWRNWAYAAFSNPFGGANHSVWVVSLYATYTIIVEEEAVGAFPIPRIPRRIRYSATIPMTVTIRRPYDATIPMHRQIRARYEASLIMERLIRRQFTESFIQKRLIINKDFKRLMRTIHEYMKEDSA